MSSFPQLRKDPIVDRWVLIAPERAQRPIEIAPAGASRPAWVCAFCEGEEVRTPHEVDALRRPGTRPDEPGWHVRVVSNMFPAARADAPPQSGDPLCWLEPGYGVHELVIEWPGHETSLSALSREHVRSIFRVYRRRMHDMAADSKLQYAQLFKNHGAAAGASVEHVHSQLLAVPHIPREIVAELDGAHRWFQDHYHCAYCDLIEKEIADGPRLVASNERATAIAAFAGRFPYETWILPRRHASHFERSSEEDLDAIADLIHLVLRKLDRVIENPSYNLILHTAPLHDGPRPDYHWHWELLPRTTGIAGFELSSGWYLNPLPPETAAHKLRWANGK
jgi:UDPglucose--hexose-1-phosphate uridylyltransferase